MALWKINPQTLTDIADAIRYAEKSSGTIKVSDFERRIKALKGTPIPPEPSEPKLGDINATYEIS